MVVVEDSSGLRYTKRRKDVLPGEKIVFVSSSAGGSSSGGMTTRDNPTPSAELLFGTSEQREAQIQAFRSGGQSAFEQEVQRAKIKGIEQQKQESKQKDLDRQRATRESYVTRSRTASALRDEARLRGTDISTPLKERNFLKKIKEEGFTKLSPEELRERNIPIMTSQEIAPDMVTKEDARASRGTGGSSMMGTVFNNSFFSNIKFIASDFYSNVKPSLSGGKSAFKEVYQEVTPSVTSFVPAYKETVGQTFSYSKDIGGDIFGGAGSAIKTESGKVNLYLGESFGKPQDMGVTRWLSIAGPEKIGTFVQKDLAEGWLGFKSKKIDTTIATDIFQPTTNLYSGIKEISKDFYATSKGKKYESSFNYPSLDTKPTSVTITSSGLGKTAKGITSVGQYLTPYYGESLIFGPAVESSLGGLFGGEKSLKQYVKAHPVESTVVGVYGGLKLYPFVAGYLRTYGREPIPKNIIPEEVLSGKKTFWSKGGGSPLGTAKVQKELFKDYKYYLPTVEKLEGYSGKGVLLDIKEYKNLPMDVPITPYHATKSVFWEVNQDIIVGKNPLHVAPGLSAHFLGISGESLFDWSFLAPFKRSGALSTITSSKNLKINLGREVKRGTYKWTNPVEPGVLYIPGGPKAEVQALWETGTIGKIISQQYYGTYKGIRYPLDIVKFDESTGNVGKILNKVLDNKDYKIVSYSGLPSTSTKPYKLSYGTGISSLTSVSSSGKVSSINQGVSYSSNVSYPKIITPFKSYSKSSSKKSSKSISSYSQIYSSIKPSKSYSKSSTSYSPSYYSSKASSSKISGSYYPSGYGSSYSKPGNFYYPKSLGGTLFGKEKYKSSGKGGRYVVSVRRGGVFKPVGIGSLRQVQQIGRGITSRTLGATYKISGGNLKGLRTPKGFYSKKSKQGILFIEQPKFRLSKLGEIKEIQRAKRKKKKRGVFDF